jgi:short subunit dehydrogenase-like uncharacterized protein
MDDPRWYEWPADTGSPFRAIPLGLVSMTDGLLIYGAYGYAGRLIARHAVRQGLEPILAGRRAEPVERLATDLGLDHAVFSLEHPSVVERAVGDVDVVLNCAGPFSATATPMLSACLDAGTDYLDIAGNVDVLESIAERDAEASAAEVAALPGVGFDVVATDCLAAQLHDEDLEATHLTLAIDGLGTFSPGTLKSMIDGLKRPGVVRQQGRLRDVPMAWKTQQFDFGSGPETAVTVPWGDVSTAYYTTGIPNIETYAAVPSYAAEVMKRARRLTPLVGTKPVRTVLKRLADVAISGPSATQRARSESRIYGEVIDEDGRQVSARLRTPDTYDVTAATAVEAAGRALQGAVEPGFQTPASAFGPEFVYAFDGVRREESEERVRIEAA